VDLGRWTAEPTGLGITPRSHASCAVLEDRYLVVTQGEGAETWAVIDTRSREAVEFVRPEALHADARIFADGQTLYVLSAPKAGAPIDVHTVPVAALVALCGG